MTTTTMTAADIQPGTEWVPKGTRDRLARVEEVNGDTVMIYDSTRDMVTLTVDEMLAGWESSTVLTPIGSKWIGLLGMPSIVDAVDHKGGSCHRYLIGDPEDDSWDNCWKVHDLFRRIGG